MNDFFLRYTDVLCLNNLYINFGLVEEVLGPADYFVELFGIENVGWKSPRLSMTLASCKELDSISLLPVL